jgi:hypothetical protein
MRPAQQGGLFSELRGARAQSGEAPAEHQHGDRPAPAARLGAGDGLARKVVEVIKAPIETKIIEEIKKPPPDTPPPPPPKLAAPPPPFIPPPEVNIQVPVADRATITTVQTTPPPVAAPRRRAAGAGLAGAQGVQAASRVNPAFPRQACSKASRTVVAMGARGAQRA